MGERPASEGDSETNRYVVWWPMKRVKSSNQEFAIAGRLVTIKTRRTSRVRIRSYVVSVLPNRGFAFHSTSAFPASKAAIGLVDGGLLLGAQDVVVLLAAALEVGEVLAGEVVEVLQRRLRSDREVMPLGPLRCGLALDALLMQVGVEVLVREAPTGLRCEQGPPRPQLLLLDGQLGRLLGDARVCALLLGVPDLLPPRVLGDVRGRPGVDERGDLTERPDLRTRHRPSPPRGPGRSCTPRSCRRR